MTRWLLILFAAALYVVAQVPIVDPYPQLTPGAGIMMVLANDSQGNPQKTVSLDSSVEGYVNVGGYTVPAKCSGTANDIYIQTWIPPTATGQTPVNMMAIWLCNPTTQTYFKPYLGNLIRQN